jgi:hypothetical protein
MCSTGKKWQHASSGGVQGSPSNTYSLKVAALICTAKGKWVQKTPSWGTIHSFIEEASDTSSQEDRDQKIEIGMFTGGCSMLCWWYTLLTKGIGINVEALKSEVWALTGRCNVLEKTVNNLQSICTMQQNTVKDLQSTCNTL